MESDKIEFSNDGKIIVHTQEVTKKLHGKLSEEDIKTSEEIIKSNRMNNNLLIDILTGAHCNLCSDSKEQKCPNKSLPYGNIQSDIVFVNKIPTLLECSTMLSHSDTSGHFLMLIINKLGLNPNQLYFTDFIKCPNKNLSEESCYACVHNYFLKELYQIKPKAIVFQGLAAISVLSKMDVLLDIPEVLNYGQIYDSYLISKDNPVKIIGIYDLDMVLNKEGDKLKECKSIVWNNLISIVNAIKV